MAKRKYTYLSPKMKGRKYAAELKANKRATNDGVVKKDKYGNVLTLSKEQRSYRAGYLDARKDIGKAAAYAKNMQGKNVR